MKLKKFLLVLIFLIAVSQFAFPAALSANGGPVEDLQLTAVCSDNPSETRCWEVTNPNSFSVAFQYLIYWDLGPEGWHEDTIPANSSIKICLPSFHETWEVLNRLRIRWDSPDGLQSSIKVTTDASCPIKPWVRTMPFTAWQVWINEENMFEMVFLYSYANDNWVRIYDMDDNLVYEVDVPINNPHIVVDLPDDMYIVRTFHAAGHIIQEFLIGKP